MSILYFFNSNKRKNKNEQKEGFLKSMRDENCKRAAAASRRSVSLRQSPAVPFAFPMLRCTAPKEWTLHCTATTSPPWPLCCLLYCSVLACLRRDYPCGGKERRRVMFLVLICENCFSHCPTSMSRLCEWWRALTSHYFSLCFRRDLFSAALSLADAALATFRGV